MKPDVDWGRFKLWGADCLEVLKTLPDNSVDSIVTDPPYGLTSGKKGGSGTASVNLESPYGRSRIGTGNGPGGFMGLKWDSDVPPVEIWAECLRVLKPGGHMLAFAGTRTQHRMACRIEDAGFEIRDMIAWVYGSGFPKSHNGEWGGTALKPALEPITVARKPLAGTVAANALEHGTGALNIDGCRVPGEGNKTFSRDAGERPRDQYRTGTTVGAAVPTDLGRWPANLIHDGSDEVLAAFPDAKGQQGATTGAEARKASVYGEFAGVAAATPRGDTGSAARFFYCPKASRSDRDEGLEGFEVKPTAARANTHPTVKPTDLMRYLCRLVTPTGGTVLDPFTGSGSTGKAALSEGFRFLGCELSPEYLAIAHARIERAFLKTLGF